MTGAVRNYLSILFFFSLHFCVLSMEDVYTDNLRQTMYEALGEGTVGEKPKTGLMPYQNRETFAKLMETAEFNPGRGVNFMSKLRSGFIAFGYLATIAPAATNVLSFYYGQQSKYTEGIISALFSVLITSLEKVTSNTISWIEDVQRDTLFQQIDIYCVKNGLQNRRAFVDVVFDAVKRKHGQQAESAIIQEL